jgi:hypothetical protein
VVVVADLLAVVDVVPRCLAAGRVVVVVDATVVCVVPTWSPDATGGGRKRM